MPSTTAQYEQAVDTLAAITRIDALAGGVVLFNATTFEGGRWFLPDDAAWASLDCIAVDVPGQVDDATRLRSACVQAIEDAQQRRELELAAHAAARLGDAQAA